MTEQLCEGSRYVINWCRWCGAAPLKVRRTVQELDSRPRRYSICPECQSSQPLSQMSLVDTLLHSTSAQLWPEFHNPLFRSLAHAQITDDECREVLSVIRSGGDLEKHLQRFVGRFRPDLATH